MVDPDSRSRIGVLAAVAIAAVSGVVTALAFAPIGAWPLAFVGVIGVLAVQWRTRCRRGALTGFIYGLTFFLVLLSWMTVIGMDAWILLAAYCALWNAALGALVAPLSRLRGSVLWVPSAWVVMEALRGRVPLGGFPWGEIAFSQGNSPVSALASIAGMAGLTFLVVALAVLTVEANPAAEVCPCCARRGGGHRRDPRDPAPADRGRAGINGDGGRRTGRDPRNGHGRVIGASGSSAEPCG